MRLRGRGISSGKGMGTALVLEEAFSFLGGIDPSTGRLTLEGNYESIEGRVLVFPRGRGSTVGSYVMLDLRRSGKAPSAIVNAGAEPIVATGAVMAEIPMVDRIDISLIQSGDEVIVDGDSGTVEVPSIQEMEVTTSILRHQEMVLILHRSERVGSCRGMWAGVSGYVEKDEEPRQTAFREIREEVRVESPLLVKEGATIKVRNGERVWVIHPFLFDVQSWEVTTDWEHTEHAWISPKDLGDFPTVPGLDRVFRELGLI